MQNSLNFYAEMRATTRIRSRIKVKCCIISGDSPQGASFETVAKDISINGIRVQLDKPLDLDTKLKLTFRLAKIENNIEVIARVIRTEELKDHKFDIGLTFENIQSGNQEEFFKRIESMDLVRLLQTTAQKKASDLHLTYNRPPILRLHGRLLPLEMEPLGTLDLKDMIYSILSEEQIARFEKFKELDFGR